MMCYEDISPAITDEERVKEITLDGLQKCGFNISDVNYDLDTVKRIQKSIIYFKMLYLYGVDMELEDCYFSDGFCIYLGNYLRSLYQMEWKETSEDMFTLIGEGGVSIDIHAMVFRYLDDGNIESDINVVELFSENYAAVHGLKKR